MGIAASAPSRGHFSPYAPPLEDCRVKGLKLALNLDGGPIACQAIALKDFRRDFCGQWEMASDNDDLRLLKPLFGARRWGLPIALVVAPK